MEYGNKNNQSGKDFNLYKKMARIPTFIKGFTFITCLLPFHYGYTNLDNEFIVEYFLYKKTSSVIGYTCNKEESDIGLIRKFSESRIKSVFWKLENKIFFSQAVVYSKIGVVFDVRCYFYQDIVSRFAEASNLRMFDELFSWLVIGTNLYQTLEYINDDSFGLSTDLVVAIFENDFYTLYDVYNPCKLRGGEINVTLLGQWDETSSLNFISKYKKTDRWNLQGMEFKISGLINQRPKNFPLLEYLLDYSSKKLDPTAKLSFAMWIHVAEMFNFTLSYIEKTVWKKGDKNGPMMGSVMKGEVDASGTPATLTHERLAIGKPVYPAIPFRSCFFFRSTSNNRINFKSIFEPLTPGVWYLFILLNVTSINIMFLLSIFTQTRLGEMYINSIMVHIGAFCQQSTDFSTNRLSGRIAIFHIFVFNLLLNNYYMASVVSTRLNNPFKKINDSLNELRKLDLTFASEKSLYFEFYMKQNNWETKSFYTKAWLKIPENKRFMPTNEAMSLVMHGDFAYHTLPEVAYPYVESFFGDRKICQLTEVHLVRPTQLSIFVPLNSSFTEMIKVGFARITERGLRNRHVKRWLARKPECRMDVLTVEKVTVYEVAPTLLFLILSISLSCIVFIVEKFVSLNKGR